MASLATIPARPIAAPISRPRIGGTRLAAFSALAVPVAAAQMPLNVYLPAIYAQHFGLPLALIGTVFLLEKLWGALADPLIGTLSDRTAGHIGRRKPWIAAGGAVFALASTALFFPLFGMTPVLLGVALFFLYLGWSMIQIPYLAWSGEISADYHERTRIVAFQTVAAASALLIVLTLPTIVDQLRPGDAPLKLAAMGSAILLTLAPALFLTLRAFPEPPLPAVRPARPPLIATIRIVFADKPLLRVLGSDFAVTLGQSTRGALFVFFVSFYMGLPQWASGLFLLQFAFGVAAGPIWLTIAKRLGKHRTAVAGELVQVAINIGLLFVAPGQLPLLLALTVAQGLAQGSGNLMLRAMVADAADRHRLETGQDRTALFFSVFSISTKAAMAVAIGIALPLVAWAGFDPKAAQNTPEALRTLLLVFALGPALAHAVSAWLVWNFPIDEAAHEETRRALASCDANISH